MTNQEIPAVFFEWDGSEVHVYGTFDSGESWPCPRDGTRHNVQVTTNRGIWLYCFDCHIFYSEGGEWGYKTSSKAIREAWT